MPSVFTGSYTIYRFATDDAFCEEEEEVGNNSTRKTINKANKYPSLIVTFTGWFSS